MRLSIVAAAMALLVSTGAHATSSLSFEADGYLIDIVVGDTSQPVVSSLSIALPGSKQPVSLPMQGVKVQIFEPGQKVLLLSFKNSGDAGLPSSFLLTVKDDVGTLKMSGRSLVGSFSWGM